MTEQNFKPLPCRCEKCGCGDIAVKVECHNSACEMYASDVTIYEGWNTRAAQPEALGGLPESVAHRLLRKNGAGDWVHDALVWSSGKPPAELMESISRSQDLYRIECAYTAEAFQALQAENERLNEKVETMRRYNNEANAQNDTLRTSVAELQAERDGFEQELRGTEKELRDADERLSAAACVQYVQAEYINGLDQAHAIERASVAELVGLLRGPFDDAWPSRVASALAKHGGLSTGDHSEDVHGMVADRTERGGQS